MAQRTWSVKMNGLAEKGEIFLLHVLLGTLGAGMRGVHGGGKGPSFVLMPTLEARALDQMVMEGKNI
jgi:hypothetical protein